MKRTIQRIANKDMKTCEGLQDIYVDFQESDIRNARALIMGPPGSCYENAILLFRIRFPNDYPFSPPQVEYVPFNSIRIHPNLYANGKVCLSFLGTWSGPPWTSIMDLSSILLSIQSLLNENPLRNEPGYEKTKGTVNRNYNQVIQYNTIDNLIIDAYHKLPEDCLVFKETIRRHLIQNNDMILKSIQSKLSIKKKIQLGIYRINCMIDYQLLLDKYIEFSESLTSHTESDKEND